MRRLDNRKSLRALAKELGVSASYLSQVKHGKRPASQKLLNMLSSSEAGTGTVTIQGIKQTVYHTTGNCRGRGSNPHGP